MPGRSPFPIDIWGITDLPILTPAAQRSKMTLDAYRGNPLLIAEPANIELATTESGYRRRQI